MTKLLVVAFGREAMTYVRRSRQMGMCVRVLDCVDSMHKQLVRWFGKDVLHVHGRRFDVRVAVAQEQFDAAVVHEDSDFVRTALITQSLREAGVRRIVVVTQDASKRTMYRRCGAHSVVVATTVEQAWQSLPSLFPGFATA
jgi:Trk K+ transport system NAD-binding subunit